METEIRLLSEIDKALINSNASTTDFNYAYDSDGKITALTAISGASELTIDYQYECK